MSPEYESSWEHLSNEERRKKIAAHISAMRIGHRILEESHAQQEAIQDFEARPYQLDAFNALWTARRVGADRGLIHLATGLGKTSVAVVDYAAFRQEEVEKTGQEPRALFVVHQNNILEQASERFAELLPDASRSFYSNRHKNLPESGITFASFQTLSNGAHRFPNNYFDYIIYDEAHHIEAMTYKKVVEHFKPKFQLGLTATPERMDEKDITDHFGKALYTKTLPEAIAEKHLATVNYNIVFDDAVKEAMENGFEPSSLAEIQRLFDVQPRNELIVERVREAQEQIRQEQNVEQVKTIIFCADLEHADAIADMMDGESYHSGKDEKQQAALLDAFRGDGLETITVRDMFNEGVDIPDARLIIFLRTTQSPTIFEQQLGRGLRKNKNKQEVTVMDFVANIERIALIRELVEMINQSQSTRRGGTKNGDGSEGPIVCGVDGEIKVHGDDSEFIFSQEVIDLLAKYNFLIEESETRLDLNSYTNEQLISLAREISPDRALSGGDVAKLSAKNRFVSLSHLTDRFGSIKNFQEACGFKARRTDFELEDLSPEDIIEIALSIQPNRPLSNPEIAQLSKSGDFVSNTVIRSRFGSMQKFREACGFNRKPTKLMSDEELLDLARELNSDEPLTTREMNSLAKQNLFVTSSTIISRFGSVNEFNKLLGFEATKPERLDGNDFDNDAIVALAKELKPEGPLTQSEVRQLSKEGKFFSTSIINARFGGMSNFNVACGYAEARRFDSKGMTPQDILTYAKTLAPNRIMSTADIIKLSKQGQFISTSTVASLFGSIRQFQKMLLEASDE